VTYPTAAENVAYTYDVASPVCGAGETFAVGRLTRITDHSGSTDYCYDRFSNVVRKVQTTADHAFTVQYAYTLGRQLRATTYPDGTVVDHVRDTQDRIQEIGVALAGDPRQVLLNNATYYPAGPSAGWTFGNGRVMARTYDKDYRASTIKDAGAGGVDIGLRYDNAGYLTQLTNAALATTPRMRYGYDALGRLTGRSDSASAPLETYTYDATGNRTSLALGTAAAQAYDYAADSHRLAAVGGVARGYDDAGNLTSIGGTAREYGYNDAGRMSLAKQAGALRATYKYNGRGEQVLRATTVSTIFVYDEAGHLLGQYGITGTPIQQYVWMDDQPVGVIAGPSLHYVEADHLGTPRAVIDATRQVAIWTLDLATEPFGNTAPNVDPDGDGTSFVYDLRFPGQRYDAASGLYYNYYRDYDPAVGRYTQTDPIGQMGGLATYGYAGNSPLLYTDPTGEIIPLLLIAGGIWTVVEIGLSIYDVYDTYKTVTNPCISNARKGVAVGLLVAGLFLPGGGYGAIDDVAEAAAKSAGQLGREGEAAIHAATGLSKNTQSFVVNGRTRIPDFVNASDTTSRLPSHLIEVKNVQSQSLTRQLRDYANLVGPGGRVDVALPPGARVSGPLQNAFDNPNNPLFRTDLPR
jgi:RHS repeat-associated protein